LYDEDLDNLEESLRRLKTEYHVFFVGNRKKPPDDLRLRVERLVQKLSECSDMSLAQRFRYTTLITRFYVYRDLWRRRMHEKEMGTPWRTDAGRGAAAQEIAGPVIREVRVCISDPETEEEKVRQLYDTLLDIRGKSPEEAPVSYRRFADYISRQTRLIRSEHGCSAVAFTIALREGSVRFTAAAEGF
jgi:hypothetical protein